MPALDESVALAASGRARAVLLIAPGNDGPAIEHLLSALEAGPHPMREGLPQWYLPNGRLSTRRDNVVARWLAEVGVDAERHADRARHRNAGNQHAAKAPDELRSAKVTFRVSGAVKARWVKAAQRSNMNLSEYVTALCNAEAERLGVK